jgi:hypothetical protein
MGRKERREQDLVARKEQKRKERELGRVILARSDEPPAESLARKRQVYAEAWELRAATLASEGLYAWMMGVMRVNRGRVLEVGTGTGRSTLQLAHAGWRVVSVDENVACLRAAEALLAKRDVSAELALRGRVRAAAPGVHAIDYAGPLPSADVRVALVEGDVLADPELVSALVAGPPFDAVVCWLVDTHDARGENQRMLALRVRSPDEYRLRTEGAAYEIAGRVLRAGGSMHVVERLQESITEVLAAALTRMHQEKARMMGLVFESLDIRPLTGGAEALVSLRSRK